MIEVDHPPKRYGTKVAVDDLSFVVAPGGITGFLGPNGAGKSTTMRLMLGLDAPSSGSVTVNGEAYEDLPAPLSEIGAMLEGDEPVNGLDPDGSRWIRNLLRRLAEDGRTVFLSSHLMSEMELTAERLIVVGRGRLIADTTVADFVLEAPVGAPVRVRSPEIRLLRAVLDALAVIMLKRRDT